MGNLRPLRLGVVSFLNARPLIEGLRARPDVALSFDVPAALPARLLSGEFDAALAPIFDVLQQPHALRIVSDACIACDGETMTVRVFSQTPPHRIRTLHVDGDSHTSVALARVIWREWFDCELQIRPIDALRAPLDSFEAVLLIGDKVVDQRRSSFAYEIDLGGAWRQHTGLPFVFAVWAARADGDSSRLAADALATLSTRLAEARDRGVMAAAQIARSSDAVERGWPLELAERYLCRCLKYKLDERYRAGIELFSTLARRHGVLPGAADLAMATAFKGSSA